MPKRSIPRKARFEAALKLAGETAGHFAERHEVTPSHLHYVLSGTRESQRLNVVIDAYITKHLYSLAAHAQ